MHVSAIDAPSDLYGAVTDVSRPLIYKLNQASMQRSTYIALHALLAWSITQLEQGIAESLYQHEVHEGIIVPEVILELAEEIAPTETTTAPTSDEDASKDITPEAEPATEPANVLSDEVLPLTSEMLPESAEDLALQAEVEAEIALVPTDAVAKPTKVAKPK